MKNMCTRQKNILILDILNELFNENILNDQVKLEYFEIHYYKVHHQIF